MKNLIKKIALGSLLLSGVAVFSLGYNTWHEARKDYYRKEISREAENEMEKQSAVLSLAGFGAMMLVPIIGYCTSRNKMTETKEQ
ncbi:Uncharacterised protein [uncultured archaeon]|nr:Uncharacterised protein [uncultured archaeon]